MDTTRFFPIFGDLPAPNVRNVRPVECIHGLMHRHQVAVQERLTQTLKAPNSCHRLVDISGDLRWFLVISGDF